MPTAYQAIEARRGKWVIPILDLEITFRRVMSHRDPYNVQDETHNGHPYGVEYTVEYLWPA